MSLETELHEHNSARAEEKRFPESKTTNLPLKDEQKSFVKSNLPFVLTDEAPWLTLEKRIWIRQSATEEEVSEALKNPQGHPSALEWWIRIMGKTCIPGDKSDVERVSAYYGS